jgi:hypothetical protein
MKTDSFNDDAEPLEALESIPALLAYLHRREGAAALRELLEMLLPIMDKQTLLQHANHLARMRFVSAAAIVREYVEKANIKPPRMSTFEALLRPVS